MLDTTPNTYRHAFRSRDKDKEIQGNLKYKDFNRFERVIDSIDFLYRELPGFDERFIISKPQHDLSFNITSKEKIKDIETKELEINNKKDFVVKANQLSPKQLNSILKKLYPNFHTKSQFKVLENLSNGVTQNSLKISQHMPKIVDPDANNIVNKTEEKKKSFTHSRNS